jgi:hypothetical protein
MSFANYCVYSHSSNGEDYPWLDNVHKGVKAIYFEEPAGSGNWKEYNDDWWKVHCKVISHDPKNLIKEHIQAFVSNDRFANLLFIFNNGVKVRSDEDPIFFRKIYELERNWFSTYSA